MIRQENTAEHAARNIEKVLKIFPRFLNKTSMIGSYPLINILKGGSSNGNISHAEI
ncbi:MAG: hypothetical protein IJI78_06595 [Oscillospiraceae bacterium]|nr:hypothetical protein [Oscillospiraceae bacterium]